MAVLPIKFVPDPVLRQKSQPVERVTKRIQKLMKDMADTMYDAKGVGLAAPQVGILQRIIVIDVGEGLIALANPRLIARDGLEVDVEGCLSIPELTGYVERAAVVEVEGLDDKGRPVRLHAEGMFARALQHELDHLDGILITDIATSVQSISADDEEIDDGSEADVDGENDENDDGVRGASREAGAESS